MAVQRNSLPSHSGLTVQQDDYRLYRQSPVYIRALAWINGSLASIAYSLRLILSLRSDLAIFHRLVASADQSTDQSLTSAGYHHKDN